MEVADRATTFSQTALSRIELHGLLTVLLTIKVQIIAHCHSAEFIPLYHVSFYWALFYCDTTFSQMALGRILSWFVNCLSNGYGSKGVILLTDILLSLYHCNLRHSIESNFAMTFSQTSLSRIEYRGLLAVSLTALALKVSFSFLSFCWVSFW